MSMKIETLSKNIFWCQNAKKKIRTFREEMLLRLMHPRLPRRKSGIGYRDRRLTTNFELWVEIFCVPTCFHVRIPKPCLSVCPYPENRNHPVFVNISPTLVIDTSMERSSRVLQHGKPKNWFFFSKSLKLNLTCILTCAEELKSTFK